MLESQSQDGTNQSKMDQTSPLIGDSSTSNGNSQEAKTGGNGADDLIEKLTQKKQEAYKEAKNWRTKYEATEAELKAYKDREKSEQQKLQERAEQAERQIEAERQARTKLERVNLALQHGCMDAEYIAWKLGQDKVEDVDKFFTDLKKNSPYLFKQTQVPAVPSAEGGPGGTKKNPKAEEIAAVEKSLSQERDPTSRIFLQRKLNKLKNEV